MPPDAVVKRFQEGLLVVMKKAAALSIAERYDRLVPRIEEAFHLPIMINVAVGPYWKEASESQRERLVRAFKRKNISTVATLFDRYSGQVFEVLGDKPAPQDTRIVETRIVDSDGDSVALDYRLIAVGGEWRIIDVIVDHGISEMSVRRSEYLDTLKKGGIEGLIAALDKKADELLAAK